MNPEDPELVALEEIERQRLEEARKKRAIIFGATYINTKSDGSSRHVKPKIVIRVDLTKSGVIVVYKWGLKRIRKVPAKSFLLNCEIIRLPNCAVPGCHRAKVTKLLCNAHLLRWRSGKGIQINDRIGKAKVTRRLCDDPQSPPPTSLG